MHSESIVVNFPDTRAAAYLTFLNGLNGLNFKVTQSIVQWGAGWWDHYLITCTANESMLQKQYCVTTH